MFTGLENEIVNGIAGVALAAASGAIAYLAKHAKAWFVSHTNTNISTTANNFIDGFTKVADSVVHDLNDRVVRDAQTNGVLTPELFEQVKRDAVQSVMDQTPSLVALGTSLGTNVQALAFSLVAQSFNKLGVIPNVAPVVSTTVPTSAPVSATAGPSPTTIGGAQA